MPDPIINQYYTADYAADGKSFNGVADLIGRGENGKLYLVQEINGKTTYTALPFELNKEPGVYLSHYACLDFDGDKVMDATRVPYDICENGIHITPSSQSFRDTVLAQDDDDYIGKRFYRADFDVNHDQVLDIGTLSASMRPGRNPEPGGIGPLHAYAQIAPLRVNKQ